MRSEAQSKTRQMKDAWWAAKAQELQGYADQHSTRLFFSGPTSTVTPIRASDDTLLMEKAHILECWTAHFSRLLNKTSCVEDQAIQNMPQRPLIHSAKAVTHLQTGN